MSRRCPISSEFSDESDDDYHKSSKKRQSCKNRFKDEREPRDNYEPRNGNIGAPRGLTICSCCGRPGHSYFSCFMKLESCRNCGKVGHLSRVCRKRANDFWRNKKTTNYTGKRVNTKNDNHSEAQKTSGKVFNVYDGVEAENNFKVGFLILVTTVRQTFPCSQDNSENLLECFSY